MRDLRKSLIVPVGLTLLALPGWAPQAGWRFGIGGRTGGATDNHWIDDLLIETDAVPFTPTPTSTRSPPPTRPTPPANRAWRRGRQRQWPSFGYRRSGGVGSWIGNCPAR